MLLEVSVALFVCYLVAIFVRHLHFRQIINRLPGWSGWPIIGDALNIKPDPLGFFQQTIDLCQQNDKAGITKFWTGYIPFIFVFKARTVEELLSSTKHTEKNVHYKPLRMWLQYGLLTSNGEKWQKRRKIITPTFHFKILEEFVKVFNEKSRILVRRLEHLADGPSFDIQPFMYRCMLDTICEAAMGTAMNLQVDSDSEYVRTLYRECQLIHDRLKYPWLWNDFVYRLTSLGRENDACLKILHGFTRKVINERIVERTKKKQKQQQRDETDSGRKRRLAFLDMLLEVADSDHSLTAADIQEEVDTFMFEGHDTTASGSVWLLYMLACYPDMQLRLRQEIDSVLGVSDSDVTMDDVNQMKYMECFIKETLRLYPPVAWFGRSTSEQCIMGGYTVPKGCSITVSTYQLHRDPEHFPDPEKFDPDRWTDDKQASRHPFSYIPFSAGVRNCIGQKFAVLELKVMLCLMLRNFTLACSVTRDDIVVTNALILKPHVPVDIQLIKRS